MSEPKELLMPPDHLIHKWHSEYSSIHPVTLISELYRHLCYKAAQWGSDQELEACCDWLKDFLCDDTATELCAARRPKPVSALELFNGLMSALDPAGEYSNYANRIRRALEALPNE